MKITKIAAAGVLVAAGAAMGAVPAAAQAPKCPTWDGVQPQAPTQSTLAGVAVLRSCPAWAVGDNHDSGSPTLIQQINGSSWVHQTAPPASTGPLTAVAAVSVSDAWAVGSQSGHILIDHWDGASWKIQPVHLPGGESPAGLSGVAASSAKNVWAVGSFGPGKRSQTLIMHWNGKTWRRLPSPSPGGPSGRGVLTSVTVVSAKQAWAVGYYQTAKHFRHTLILGWNGAAWRQVPSPNPDATGNCLLTGVTSTKTGHAWAVGYLMDPGPLTLFLQWDGSRWTQILSPNPTPLGTNILSAVAAASETNVWAVGWFAQQEENPSGLILHWDGQTWTQYFAPNPGLGENAELLNGVATAAHANAWVVGQYSGDHSDGAQGLALHWDGHSWSD